MPGVSRPLVFSFISREFIGTRLLAISNPITASISLLEIYSLDRAVAPSFWFVQSRMEIQENILEETNGII